MKKYHILIISLLCLLPFSAAAESNLGAHNFIIWANGGIVNYIGKASNATSSIGGGGGLGLGYEWRDRTLLIQTGVGARYSQSGLNPNDRVYTIPNLYDSESFELDYEYLESKRKDRYTQLAVQVPILIGAHYNHFYFLAGAKLNAYVMNSSKITGTYSSRGVYDLFIDPFENMDNHMFFKAQELNPDPVKYPLKFNVAVSAEIGGEFTVSDRGYNATYMRVAAFADFNVLDDRTQSKNDMLILPTPDNTVDKATNLVSGLQWNDYLHSSAAENPLRQLYAGVKLTVLFSSGVKYGCVMCEGGYPSARDRRRGSRLVR